MSDVLLTHGYFLFEDEKEQQIMRPYPTLGLLYIAAYLRRAGLQPEIFDSTFERREVLIARLRRDSGVIGIYTNLMTRRPVLDIVREAKADALRLVNQAQEEERQIRERHELLQRQFAAYLANFRALLERQLGEIEGLQTHAQLSHQVQTELLLKRHA